MLISYKYNIDESHSLGHSLSVLNHAHNIYESELPNNPLLKLDERAIYVSAIIHDMCDKKYLDQEEGIYNIQTFLKEKMTYQEIKTVKNIISTMSYSHVKNNGNCFCTSRKQNRNSEWVTLFQNFTLFYSIYYSVEYIVRGAVKN